MTLPSHVAAVAATGTKKHEQGAAAVAAALSTALVL